ncbi:MAG TPA: trigger factor [Bacillota bacterium]
MKSTLAKLEDNRAHLEIEVPAEEVAKALDRAYRKVARKVLIPGFRKGRAPRPLVERHVGKAVLYEEALDDLLPEAYARAVAETGIEPIDRPEISQVKLREGEPLSFKAVVQVKPEVELGDYRAIRVEKTEPAVTADDVERVLAELREQQAQLVAEPDDRPAERGHFATIDFRGTIDGQPFGGGSGENYTVEIGSGRLIGDFEDQLLGMRVGETREITIPYPEDFANRELAGKTATFTVTLKELKRKELPPLDDAFAQSVGSFGSLEELRKDVENRLSQRAAAEAEADFRQRVVQAAVEQARVDIPEVLVQRRIDQLISAFKRRLESQNVRWEDFLRQSGESIEQLRESFCEQAAADVKTDLVLEAIARREGIEPGEDDFAAEAVKLAETYGQKVDEVRKLLERADVRADLAAALRIRKTIDFLVAQATAAQPET